MRMQRSILPFLLALCLLASSQLVGCGTGDSAGTSRAQSDIGASPILLRDPSPGQLAVYLNVTIGGYEPTTRGTTSVSLSFSSNGRLVQFAGHERLTCNGTAVPLQKQVTSFQVAQAPTSTLEGHPFSCTYSAGGISATLMLTIPYAPVIRSPQDLAQVPRSPTSLPMKCEAGSSWASWPWDLRRKRLPGSIRRACCRPPSIPARSQPGQDLSRSRKCSTSR